MFNTEKIHAAIAIIAGLIILSYPQFLALVVAIYLIARGVLGFFNKGTGALEDYVKKLEGQVTDMANTVVKPSSGTPTTPAAPTA